MPWHCYCRVCDEIEASLHERHRAIGWRSEAVAPKLPNARAS